MLAGGKLFTWGRNELGQLGNGTLTGTWSADETVVLPPMYEQAAADLVSIVTRQTFMIALASDGTVRTWGSNASGQLGYATPADCGSNGTSPCGRAPAIVPGISDAVAVAAGFDHALVLRADGSVIAFGSNAKGQLGITEAAAFAEDLGITSRVSPRSTAPRRRYESLFRGESGARGVRRIPLTSASARARNDVSAALTNFRTNARCEWRDVERHVTGIETRDAALFGVGSLVRSTVHAAPRSSMAVGVKARADPA